MILAEVSMITTVTHPAVNASGEYCVEINVSEDVRVESVEVLTLSLSLDDVLQNTSSTITIIDDDCKS